MTLQFAVSSVTAGSDTRGLGHDHTGMPGLTEVKQRARASWSSRGLSRRCDTVLAACEQPDYRATDRQSSSGSAQPARAKINIVAGPIGDRCGVADDCVGRWPDYPGAADCTAGSTNLGVRVGHVTESGDVCSR
jgi:hypothetical protein